MNKISSHGKFYYKRILIYSIIFKLHIRVDLKFLDLRLDFCVSIKTFSTIHYDNQSALYLDQLSFNDIRVN